VIPLLIQNPTMKPEEVCQIVVREFKHFYLKEDDLPVQLSAFDLTQADELRDKLEELGSLLITRIKAGATDLLNALLGSHFQTQRYDEDQFFDLYDFSYMMTQNCKDVSVRGLCEDIMKLIGDRDHPNFVVASEFHGEALQFSYGLAIYFPWAG